MTRQAGCLATRWVTEASKRRNLSRIAIGCEGRLRTDLQSHNVMLHDISQAGAKVEVETPGALRGEAMLSLPDLPIAGVVRWENPAFLRFLRIRTAEKQSAAPKIRCSMLPDISPS